MSEYFENRKKAAQWLEAGGYPVKQSKFYQDCPGVVPLNEDKTVSKFLVMQYGIAQQRKTAGGDVSTSAEAAEADLRKKIADAGIAEQKERKLGREEDGLWLYADDAYAMLAGLVAGIRSAVRHQAYSRRRELVEIACGNPDKADEVYQEIEGFIDAGLNEVAGGGVKGKFQKVRR
jgi:hypothetical protein